MRQIKQIELEVLEIEKELKHFKTFQKRAEQDISELIDMLKALNTVESIFLAKEIDARRKERYKLLADNLKNKFFKEKISLDYFDAKYEELNFRISA